MDWIDNGLDRQSRPVFRRTLGRHAPLPEAKRGREDKASDFIPRINTRDATNLSIAEVVLRRQFVPGVFDEKVLSKRQMVW